MQLREIVPSTQNPFIALCTPAPTQFTAAAATSPLLVVAPSVPLAHPGFATPTLGPPNATQRKRRASFDHSAGSLPFGHPLRCASLGESSVSSALVTGISSSPPLSGGGDTGGVDWSLTLPQKCEHYLRLDVSGVSRLLAPLGKGYERRVQGLRKRRV